MFGRGFDKIMKHGSSADEQGVSERRCLWKIAMFFTVDVNQRLFGDFQAQ